MVSAGRDECNVRREHPCPTREKIPARASDFMQSGLAHAWVLSSHNFAIRVIIGSFFTLRNDLAASSLLLLRK
jgi:hypothetical protein